MRNFITYEWFTVFTLIGMVHIVASKLVNTLRFNDFLYVISNSKYLKIYAKEQKFIDRFDGLLFINLALALSIFIYFSYSVFVTPIEFELFSFLKLLFAVATLLLIKTLVERLLGSLFDIEDLMDAYLFQKTTFKNYAGLLFLVANIFLLYSKIEPSIIIITAIFLAIIINSIGFLSSFKNYQKTINLNFFYFLLYLCALEIGPYILLYKVIKEYNV